MARIVTAAARLQSIVKTSNVAETIVKSKQTIKLSEEKVKFAASKSLIAKMQSVEEERRLPLKQAVADCTKRWFQESLKEAKSGDIGMQVLVGQMYCSGYGIPKDMNKGKAWFQKASRSRSKILNLCAKPPGYSPSESDSDNQDNKKK